MEQVVSESSQAASYVLLPQSKRPGYYQQNDWEPPADSDVVELDFLVRTKRAAARAGLRPTH